MDNERKNIAETVIELITRATGTEVPTPEGAERLALVHKDMRIESLQKFLPAPNRIIRDERFADIEDWIAYVSRWAVKGSIVKVKEGGAVAFLDYHASKAAPSWCSHTATLAMRHSPEWLVWNKASGVALDQVVFANFIEDNAADLLAPEPADIIALALKLRGTVTAEFASELVLESGDATLNYQRSNRTNGVAVPGRLTLQLRPWVGAPAQEVRARLCWRPQDGGKVTFAVNLIGVAKLLVESSEDFIERVEAETGLDVYLEA